MVNPEQLLCVLLVNLDQRYLLARKLNEDLTAMRFELLQLVKGLNNVKTVFTRDGKIHCNMNDNSKIVIENPDDLFKLGLDEVDYKLFGIVDLE